MDELLDRYCEQMSACKDSMRKHGKVHHGHYNTEIVFRNQHSCKECHELVDNHYRLLRERGYILRLMEVGGAINNLVFESVMNNNLFGNKFKENDNV